MSKLSDFGGGSLPEKNDDDVAHDTREDRVKHRRKQYRLGRCRGISTNKGTRCGAGVIEDTDGPYCFYHGCEADSPTSHPVTIDDDADLLARWCGTRPTEWEEIPERCRAAIMELIR